jgi:hypothetical protein
MSDLQAAKALVLDFYAALDAAPPEGCASVLTEFCAPDMSWRGVHPFGTQSTAEDVAATFWQPLKSALTPIQRRPDILLASRDKTTGEIWVTQMGHLMGNLDAPWLGIPATRKLTCLRTAEFHRIGAGRIQETVSFCDIIGLMHQAGLAPLAPSLGFEGVTPAPRTQDGNLHGPQSDEVSATTADLIERLIASETSGGLYDPAAILQVASDDLVWFGPAGIGTLAGHADYEKGVAAPIRDGVTVRRAQGQQRTLVEGAYAARFADPIASLQNKGGFMGMTMSSVPADLRMAEVFRREGTAIAEAWVFWDMLGFLQQQGVDILDRIKL